MSSCTYPETEPSAWVKRHASLIKPQGRILDVGAGSGRNACWLAAQGWRVEAVDKDEAALSAMQGLIGIHTRVADIENAPWPYAGQKFDGIVICRYLHRPLFQALMDSLSTDGILIYETFMLGHEAYGRLRNPDFLLRPNELLDIFVPPMVPVAFEQGLDPSQYAVVQRICLSFSISPPSILRA
jgi:SAM-dependent methyltransferase